MDSGQWIGENNLCRLSQRWIARLGAIPWDNSTGVTGTVANPFRYAGAMLDSTGLYKMGHTLTTRDQ